MKISRKILVAALTLTIPLSGMSAANAQDGSLKLGNQPPAMGAYDYGTDYLEGNTSDREFRTINYYNGVEKLFGGLVTQASGKTTVNESTQIQRYSKILWVIPVYGEKYSGTTTDKVYERFEYKRGFVTKTYDIVSVNGKIPTSGQYQKDGKIMNVVSGSYNSSENTTTLKLLSNTGAFRYM